MATTLGLSFFFHDSAAALVIDGKIIACAAEERFCRRKHTHEFPKRAIEYCLEAGGLRSLDDIDAIVFYEKPIIKLYRVVESLISVWPRGLVTFARRLPAFLTSKLNVYGTIAKALPGYGGQILFADHHLSHAASAFYCSPFDEAAILTIDGVGEWETTTLGVGRGRKIELTHAIHFPHSIGLLYSALTSYLGFRVNDGEWKVMGLAPYGKPKYVEQFEQLVDLRDDGSFRLNMKFFAHHFSSQWAANHRRWEALFGFPRRDPDHEIEGHHEDLARSGQAVVEKMILNLAREAKRRSGCRNLVIAGGVGLNSVANWKLEKSELFDGLWVQPAAGDDGGALGAALLVSQELLEDPPCPELKDVYLGPEFSASEIESLLERREIRYERLDDAALVERTADLIGDGKVVGWFQGRMEFGPRSLGARSILGDPTNPRIKEIINGKIKYREYFRPFAPAVPLDDVHRYFAVEPGTELPFMLKVPPVLPERRVVIPAVTHEDGSGRVQTVARDRNPRFYDLLKALERRNGVPVVLNTSFNIRGEPIVCTPEDAYECYLGTGIDALVLGNFLVTEKPVTADASEGWLRSDALEAQLGDTEGEGERGVSSNITAATLGKTSDTTERVLSFYKELPFNFYSNALDTAAQLLRGNRIRAYPVLHRRLENAQGAHVIDVGCGAGWFANSCAHFYGQSVTGIDLNPVVLRQARSVARLMPGCEHVQFIETDVFAFEPGRQFDVVNSLGVLHHTPDCHGAIRKAVEWISPGGFLHLGLYHHYGRKPFLDHFAKLLADGASHEDAYQEFAQLNPDITDPTHMLSWFRDQVLHPHETQHTYEEIRALLESLGLVLEATSINGFKPMPNHEKLVEMERAFEKTSEVALHHKRRYYPGFFVMWARKP